MTLLAVCLMWTPVLDCSHVRIPGGVRESRLKSARTKAGSREEIAMVEGKTSKGRAAFIPVIQSPPIVESKPINILFHGRCGVHDRRCHLERDARLHTRARANRAYGDAAARRRSRRTRKREKTRWLRQRGAGHRSLSDSVGCPEAEGQWEHVRERLPRKEQHPSPHGKEARPGLVCRMFCSHG